MRRALLGLLVSACVATPGVGSTSGDEGTTSSSTTMTGGATWQDVPSTSDASTTGVSMTSAPDSDGSASVTEESSSTSGGSSDTSTETTSSGLDPDSASSEETGPPPMKCEDLDCTQCAMCSVVAGGACEEIATECMGFDGCESAATCLVTCGVSGLCFDDCCEDVPLASVMVALDVNDCVALACATACSDYPQGICD